MKTVMFVIILCAFVILSQGCAYHYKAAQGNQGEEISFQFLGIPLFAPVYGSYPYVTPYGHRPYYGHAYGPRVYPVP